jgi:crotonobetainyl-CoA:carnitine CoA-transferase CaiB-like acyl-CoA transferase
MLGYPEALAGDRWLAPTAGADSALQMEFEAFFYPWLLERTKFEIWEAAQAAHVLCGPLLTMEDVADDPVLASRGLWADVEHPDMGRVRIPGRPFITDPPWSLRRPAPRLGQHTDEVLAEAGYTPEAIAGLRAEGVI